MSSKKNCKKKRQSNFIYDFVKVTGAIPAWLWLRPKVVHVLGRNGKKIKGGALIAANHVSFVDPIALHLAFWYRRLWSLATKDLYTSKIRTFFFNASHCIMLDKTNFTVGALHEVCDKLKEGKAVCIFPEGGVHREDEEVQSYKSGAILMAHLSKKPIVPVYIHKPARWYGRYHVVIGEPVDVSAICGVIPSMDDIKNASDRLREKELELQEFHKRKVLKIKENKQ